MELCMIMCLQNYHIYAQKVFIYCALKCGTLVSSSIN